jgi:Outer membrane protein beta-barrel domain
MRARLFTFAVGALLVSAIPAAAQRRSTPVPNTGMWSIGGAIGAGVPTDPSLSGGLALAGNVERYLTRRLSIRGELGGAWNDIVGRHFTGTVSPVFLDGNVVYNWEGGIWHPYVTGGLGMYRYRSFESLAPGRTDTSLGLDVGAGLEYFTNRRVTLTAEFLYHDINQINTPLATFTQGQFWTITGGVKRYF